MLNLSLRFGKGPILLREIAADENISEKYLSQIIIPLKAAGLVRSFRGARGGYVLAKTPKAITVFEIVEILDGPLDVVGCVSDPSVCQRISFCVTRNLWNNLNETIATSLKQISLADLVNECHMSEKSAINYTI